jgi:hypothetical protein
MAGSAEAMVQKMGSVLGRPRLSNDSRPKKMPSHTHSFTYADSLVQFIEAGL